ncbi:hypothetical protein CVT24_000197 [Panaeolus cyanescens]|uniref:Uncharacterized protein n=1 Tax=Panaeolus cyanescens TaxID=181874 RepID=A0A409W351_9AGAR|nr:hypothetical protein CVT24_000197 [Panaeolus cyanescens]
MSTTTQRIALDPNAFQAPRDARFTSADDMDPDHPTISPRKTRIRRGYKTKADKLHYLTSHPFAGLIGPQGRFIFCLMCVKWRSGVLCPEYILCDIRKNTHYDLVAWKKHCVSKHRDVHEEWEKAYAENPNSKFDCKHPCRFDAQFIADYARVVDRLIGEKDRRRLEAKTASNTKSKNSATSTSTTTPNATSDDESIHPETGVPRRSLLLLARLLRRSQRSPARCRSNDLRSSNSSSFL